MDASFEVWDEVGMIVNFHITNIGGTQWQMV